MNYYNEFDPFAAEWLRQLIKAGVIPPGDVDERSIEDVTPNELVRYTQCHFFAGIGGWSEALRLAGVSPDTPLWTGSCPCQPFSTAGKGAGFDDERHLWPAFHYLIEQCQPERIFGEQVSSSDGRDWLALVHNDFEATGYQFGAVDVCAAGIGAPHIRQRLFWVADRKHEGSQGRVFRRTDQERENINRYSGCNSATSRMDNANNERFREAGEAVTGERPAGTGTTKRLANTHDADRGRHGAGQDQRDRDDTGRQETQRETSECGADGEQPGPADPLNSFWGNADWLLCRDGKFRPVEPGTFPLADGVQKRVGRLRGYGNAIVPEVAAEFIRACQ